MNYQRIRVNFINKIKYGISSGINSFVWLTSVVVATLFGFISITGTTLSVPIIVYIVSAIFLICIIITFIKGKVGHLPDKILFDTEHDKSYTIEYETKNVCLFFNNQTISYFGRDYVDDHIVEKWLAKNPKGFLYLKNQLNEPCAAIAIFSIKNSFMEQFIKGRVTEHDLDSDDVLNLELSKKANTLYLAVIIVHEPHSIIGNKRALVMLWGLIKYIKKNYGTKKERKIYAVPVNNASENLLKNFGFSIDSFAKCRRDKHNLYSLQLTKSTLNNALMRIGDYSNICTVKL